MVKLGRRTGVLPAEKAFTLIELLAVLLMVGVSVGLILPAFGRAGDVEGLAKCAANLRRVGQADQMYAQDYNGHGIPDYQSAQAGLPALGGLAWAEHFEYLPGRPDNVYVCPLWEPYEDKGDRWVMYGIMSSHLPGSAPYRRGRHTSLWDIEYPEEYMRFADSVNLMGDSAVPEGSQVYQIRSEPDTRPRRLHLRHGGRANVVFADGRVEASDAGRVAEALAYMISADGRTYTKVMADGELEEIERDVEGRL